MQAGATPVEVSTGSRLLNPQELVPDLGDVSGALFKAAGNRSLPRTTIGLVQLCAGQWTTSR
jgi:hypothetical protein